MIALITEQGGFNFLLKINSIILAPFQTRKSSKKPQVEGKQITWTQIDSYGAQLILIFWHYHMDTAWLATSIHAGNKLHLQA